MLKNITLLLLILTFASCKKSETATSENSEKEKIKAARWILGTWENKSADGILKEIWNKENDSTFLGKSYFMKGKDTIHFETIILQQKGDQMTYVTTIIGQNNDKPITFKMSNDTETELVFENPTQDYPKKIKYKTAFKGNLTVEISGIQASKSSSEKYEMKKIK